MSKPRSRGLTSLFGSPPLQGSQSPPNSLDWSKVAKNSVSTPPLGTGWVWDSVRQTTWRIVTGPLRTQAGTWTEPRFGLRLRFGGAPRDSNRRLDSKPFWIGLTQNTSIWRATRTCAYGPTYCLSRQTDWQQHPLASAPPPPLRERGEFVQLEGRSASQSLRASQSHRNSSMPNMTGRPGYWTVEMNGGSSAPYLARTPCVPLFCALFNRGGNRRAFRLPGAGGDHFYFTVEPSSGHIRCRIQKRPGI